MEKLLSRIDKKSFGSRDEEEVAGYAELMDIIFDIPSKDDAKLGKSARAILGLFDDKREWGVSEIAKALELNVNTAAKTIKTLVKNGYLTKHGTTRGAWYEKPVGTGTSK